MAEKMERIMIIKADIVFAISGQLRSFIAQEYSVNPEKIYLLKNSMPDYRAEIFENRENSEPFIIGYLGSLTAYEGLDRIVDALSLALKSGILFKVLIGGEGVYRRELEIQIKKLGLTDNLEFVGTVNRNEIEDFYRRIDLMVYPRRSSQLTELIPPMKVLEPACFQVLTLTSNLAPIVEICEGTRKDLG